MNCFSPQISVIMSVYKEPIEWIKQSIDSVLNQTFQDFEYIIICDNPDYEEAISLLNTYEKKYPQISIIYNPNNIGLTKSLNKGIKKATGKYIARLDADDISLPKRFERQYAYMQEHPDVIVLGTNVKCIGKNLFHQNPTIVYEDGEIKAQLLLKNGFVHSSVFIRKKVLDDNNILYDEDYRQTQDLRLWETLIHYGKYANLRDKLILYRVSDQQITKAHGSGQVGNAQKVRFRLQKAWLEKVGFYYSEDDIANKPYEILVQIRKYNGINQTVEFKAFLQYVYLNTTDKSILRNFFSGDWRYFSIMDRLRLLKAFISL